MTTATTEALRLTDRINRIEPSATMAVVAEADKLRSQGIDVVDFGAGEPHFATPQHIKDAAIAAIQGNFTKYTAVAGTAELRDAIAHRHNVDFDSDYRREEVIASTGGKHALFNAIQVLVDHGDEVILPVPYWVSFKDIIRYAGGTCVLLEADESQGFRVTAEMVAGLITPRTKAIILNSPSNPSGAVMSAEDMTEVIRLAHERGNLGAIGRVLRLSELHGQEFFRGLAAGIQGADRRAGIALEDLCDDRLASGLCDGSRSSDQRDGEVAEPVHFESNLDRAEGRGRCAEGAAGMRARDAARVHPAARSCGEGAALDSGRDLHYAGGRVLCVSEYFIFSGARRPEIRI